jgi:hypothetical protein
MKRLPFRVQKRTLKKYFAWILIGIFVISCSNSIFDFEHLYWENAKFPVSDSEEPLSGHMVLLRESPEQNTPSYNQKQVTAHYSTRTSGRSYNSNARFGIRGLNFQNQVNLEKSINLTLEAGARWYRNGIKWDSVEPSNGTYSWDTVDNVIKKIMENNISVITTLRCISDWAAPNSGPSWGGYSAAAFPAMEHTNDYREFVIKAVERYDGDAIDDAPFITETINIKHWQIENEPALFFPTKGITFWNGTPQELAELTKIAYSAIKTADPEALVVLPSFTMYTLLRDNGVWLEALLENITLQDNNTDDDFDFDIFDIHMYENYTEIPRVYSTIRSILEAHGFRNKTIWSTEASFNWENLNLSMNWTEFNDFIAKDVIKRNTISFTEGADKIFFHKFKDDQKSSFPPGTLEGFRELRGLVDKKRVHKPFFFAFKTMTENLDQFTTVENIGTSDYHGSKFTFDEKEVYVLWNDTIDGITVDLGLGMVKLIDIYGNESVQDSASLPLNDYPIFVERFPVDLRLNATDIEFSNNSPMEGELIKINVTLYNDGVIPVDTVVDFLVNGNPIENKIISLNEFSKNNSTFEWLATKGVHNLTFDINPDKTVFEVDYNNNRVTKPIAVYSLPDLWIAKISISDGDIIEGERVFINVTIRLDSELPIDKVIATELMIDNENVSWNKIRIWNETKVIVSFNWTGVMGVHNITVIVDRENVLRESYEINNIAIKEILVKPKEINDQKDKDKKDDYNLWLYSITIVIFLLISAIIILIWIKLKKRY